MKLHNSTRVLFIFGFWIGWINTLAANQPDQALIEFESIISPEVANAGMVVTQESRATDIGVEILSQGGNAVDAAVAVGFALAVTLPRAGNIGGGGFMLIYDSKQRKVDALDYREMAPLRATRDMFLNKNSQADNKKSRYSTLSAGVPGTVAGLVAAHKKYGRLPFKQLVAPAIKLANSLPMSFAMAQSLNMKHDRLSSDVESRKIFIKSDGSNWKLGDSIRQQDLAKTLTRIADSNGKDFYQGKIAQQIANYFAANDGIITTKDLANYHVVWRQPVTTQLDDMQIFSMPPPSSGGIHLIQLLNIVRHFPLAQYGMNSANEVHVKAEALKYAYADRSKYLGDPDFVNVPVNRLTSEKYAKLIAQKISLQKVTPSVQIKPGQYFDQESPQTTHFSIIDKDGNIVSNTYTLNFSFGSGKTIANTGILLNNQMDDFSAKPGSPNGYGLIGGNANAIEAGKRPLSSMTPVIVTKNNKPWLVTGSPGGSRIISTVFNFLLNRIIHQKNIAEATIAPRLHHQWFPDKLQLESGFSIDTIERLKQKGLPVSIRNPWGSLQSIEYDGKYFYGFSDTRRPGALAKGLNQ
ncbi:gamma-glutamyltransferase [Aliikangiella maris]|uniref:Glutathione hydrolase proenzyme n=2 Tax=Aliikangiella maris TaxID=3162458 RepID=A0ABV2BUM4_9GAMM